MRVPIDNRSHHVRKTIQPSREGISRRVGRGRNLDGDGPSLFIFPHIGVVDPIEGKGFVKGRCASDLEEDPRAWFGFMSGNGLMNVSGFMSDSGFGFFILINMNKVIFRFFI